MCNMVFVIGKFIAAIAISVVVLKQNTGIYAVYFMQNIASFMGHKYILTCTYIYTQICTQANIHDFLIRHALPVTMVHTAPLSP